MNEKKHFSNQFHCSKGHPFMTSTRGVMGQAQVDAYGRGRGVQPHALADPEFQERRRQIFAEIFERPLFRRFPKKISISSQNVIYIPSITFFSRRPFHGLMCYFFRRGAKFGSRHRYGGGAKSLHFHKLTMLSLLFLPRPAT